MPSSNDPGALAGAHGAGGGRVCREQLADTTNSRTSQTAAQQEPRFVDIIKEDAVDHLNAAANELDWLWINGYEHESLAQIVRDLRATVVLIQGKE
jgi:hypothetical protein